MDYFKTLNDKNEDELTHNEKLLKYGFNRLNDYQIDILKECIELNFGGLLLPMGSGKTFISLILSLYYRLTTNKPILIIVSKSLISSWENEIKKFFGDEMKYIIYHKSYMNDYDI